MDCWLGETTRVGVYGGYSESSLHVQGLDESADLEAFDVGFTASQTFDQWYLMGFAGYAYNHYNVDRNINFSEFYSASNDGAYGGNLANFGIEGGRAINFGNCRLQPLAGLQYLGISNAGVTETGAGVTNLIVPGLSGQAVWSSLGAPLLVFVLRRQHEHWRAWRRPDTCTTSSPTRRAP